jgi:hypothetical protein
MMPHGNSANPNNTGRVPIKIGKITLRPALLSRMIQIFEKSVLLQSAFDTLSKSL